MRFGSNILSAGLVIMVCETLRSIFLVAYCTHTGLGAYVCVCVIEREFDNTRLEKHTQFNETATQRLNDKRASKNNTNVCGEARVWLESSSVYVCLGFELCLPLALSVWDYSRSRVLSKLMFPTF